MCLDSSSNTLSLCNFYFLGHELESLIITDLYFIQIIPLRERAEGRSYNWNWIKQSGTCLYFIHCAWFIEEEETLKLFCLWATALWSWSPQWDLLDAINPEMCHWGNENWSDRRHKVDPDWNGSIRCSWASEKKKILGSAPAGLKLLLMNTSNYRNITVRPDHRLWSGLRKESGEGRSFSAGLDKNSLH